MAHALILLVRSYQLLVSHLLPPNTCRFHPTCSQYAIDALKKYGSIKGTYLSVKRVSKCHPWHPGGYDPA
jgi:uncharacterized protein